MPLILCCFQVYSFIGAAWAASPSQLGAVTLARAMIQALSSPIGGLLGSFLHAPVASAIKQQNALNTALSGSNCSMASVEHIFCCMDAEHGITGHS